MQNHLFSVLLSCICAVNVLGCSKRKTVTAGSGEQSVKKRIVCFGDSLTDCGGKGGRYTDWLAVFLPDCEIINKGVGGDTLAGGRARFKKDVLDLKPDIVVIELDANDFWAKARTISELKKDFAFMIEKAQEHNIKVVIAGVFGDMADKQRKPIPKVLGTDYFGRQILEMERELASKYNCEHVENIQADIKNKKYWIDTNHPNKQGNRFVALRILPAVKKLLDE